MAHPRLVSSRDTRVLSLHAGCGSEDLTCDICVVSLDGLPSYDALSYAWNEKVSSNPNLFSEKADILCNGEAVPITANLGRALLYLRDKHYTRMLWIDQLCINQRDYGEREQQVRCMGEIFSYAQNCIVWLGDSNQSTEAVWNLFRDLRLYTHLVPFQTYHLAYGKESENFHGPSKFQGTHRSPTSALPPELAKVPPANHPSWDAMKDFLDREWFKRLWTLQEVVVARRCHIVCGSFAMTWNDMCAGVFALQLGGYSRRLRSRDSGILWRKSERNRWLGGDRAPLRGLLINTRASRTREAHDKIFALLSLVRPQTISRLHVQYEKRLPELFGDVVRACITKDRNLAVLAEVEMRQGRISDMPSWVPDWRFYSSTVMALNTDSTSEQGYCSAGKTEPLLPSSPSSDTLIVRGFLIAPITRLLPMRKVLDVRNTSITGRNLKALRWAHEIWDGIYRQAVSRLNIPVSIVRSPEQKGFLGLTKSNKGMDEPLIPTDMLQTALRRTVTGDLYPQPGGRLSLVNAAYTYPAYTAWQHRGFSGPPPPEVLWEHDEAVRNTMHNRRAFIAGNNDDAYLGIGLKTLREGDWVCILLGGDTPFILRPMNHKTEHDASLVKEWVLVSECYVHGLMDGEAMERVNESGFEYKDFVLPGSWSPYEGKAKL